MGEGLRTLRGSFTQMVLHMLDCTWHLVQEPWLVAAFMFFCVGLMCWGCAFLRLQLQPWVPLLMSALLCISIRFALLVEREGLVALLPCFVTSVLHRPLFELLGSIINAAAVTACNLLRVAMLACMELDDEQRMEILTGMDPKFRHCVFQEPFGLLLPWWLRRILFGRTAILSSKVVNGSKSAPTASGAANAYGSSTFPSSAMSSIRRLKIPENSVMSAEGCSKSSQVQPALQRKGTADSLLELVRGMEGIARTSGATEDVSVLERILTEKMMGRTVWAARSLASSAQAQAFKTLRYSQEKVSEIGEGVREVVSDPRAKVTAASAVGGAVAVGTTGGSVGLVSGGLLGAACGLVPAVFTFGLSIPVGAAIGSTVGLGVGATLGGTSGFVGGGTLGYKIYGREESNEAQMSLLQQPAQ